MQDAFGAALSQWPFQGRPERPAAWLAVAARNKALDRLRGQARLDSIDTRDEAAAWRLGFSNPEDSGKVDDTLALMFVACHPALGLEEQTMLTLQTVCGFNPREIARSFLSTPEAVTQRLVRAKRRIRDLDLSFEIPEGHELAQRLPGLLNAIYLLFNGGYTAAEGEPLMAQALCAEALRLATLLTSHPATAGGETQALAALMCFHHARAAARTAEGGDLILLAEQDRGRWDQALIARGFTHLHAAMSTDTLTALHLEAGIASVHAGTPSFERDRLACAHPLLRRARGAQAHAGGAPERCDRVRLRARAPPRASSSSTRSPGRGSSRAMRSITPHAGICSRSSAGRQRLPPHWGARLSAR